MNLTVPDHGDLYAIILKACDEVLNNPNLAHHLSKASIERWFAIELAACLEQRLDRMALVECGGVPGLGNIDVALVRRENTRDASRLKPSLAWDTTAIAIELKAAHLRDGVRGYENALLSDLTAKPQLATALGRHCEHWLGVLITTDGGWGPHTPGGKFADRVEKMHARRLALAPGLREIDRRERRNLSYREWSGSVWVQLVCADAPNS